MAKRSPLPVDILVGQNIRIFRLQAGWSQAELGYRIGVTFQQVQKYENGVNRVGAGRLSQVADVLRIPILALFDGTETPAVDDPRRSAHALLAEPHSLRLLQAFDKIENKTIRAMLLDLIERLAAPQRRAAPAKQKKKR
jgi:transcriptional regulator with XRE-family HTH domain